jgi:amino acid transporter
MSNLYAYSRLIMEGAKDGFIPFGSYLSAVSRFNSPMNALILAGGISLVCVLGPPPGGAYDFLVLLASYPEWIFYSVSVLGVLVLRFTRPEIYRPVKAFLPGTVIFVISCVLLAVVPFVPPKVKPSSGIEYWVVPSLGLTFICLIGGLFFLFGMEQRVRADKDIFEEANKAFKDIENSKQSDCKV